MRRKFSTGLVLFVAGILLDIVSDLADIWILGVLAGILWPVGMVVVIKALMFLKQNKPNDASHQNADKKD